MILHAFRKRLAEELDKIPTDAERALESNAVTTTVLARRLLEHLAIDDHRSGRIGEEPPGPGSGSNVMGGEITCNENGDCAGFKFTAYWFVGSDPSSFEIGKNPVKIYPQ